MKSNVVSRVALALVIALLFASLPGSVVLGAATGIPDGVDKYFKATRDSS